MKLYGLVNIYFLMRMFKINFIDFNSPKNVGYKRIFLFTNDDNPINSDSNLRTKCIERTKDLIESDITIELFIVKPKDKKFDTSLFWTV